MAESPVFNAPPISSATSARFNVMSIVAFVFAFLFSIVGVILGFIALAQIRRTGERGHGLALAAVILGIVFLVLSLIVDVTIVPQLLNATAGTR